MEMRWNSTVIAMSSVVAVLGFAALGALAFAQREQPGARAGTEPQPNQAAPALHPVVIQPTAGAPRVRTGTTNFHGEAVTVACGTCHTTTQPNARTRTGAALVQFHQGLNYAHGELTCLSCHNPANYDSLRLADGRPVEFADVMTLCAQCHGPQARDYAHGAHGGMTGHWDLAKGPRTRKNCIHCHDAHAPKYPLARPVFPPRDRISVPVKTPAASH